MVLSLEPHLETLSEATESGDETVAYTVLVDMARDMKRQMDLFQFGIGDIAATVETVYGQGQLKDFAQRVVLSQSTTYEYIKLAQYYPTDVRSELSDLPISYSHFRAAARFNDLAESLEFLKDAAANLWTVDQTRMELLERLGKPLPPRKVGEGIVSFAGPRNELVVHSGDVGEVQRGKKYRMVLYEIKDDGS
jgi:hypothetical protein